MVLAAALAAMSLPAAVGQQPGGRGGDAAGQAPRRVPDSLRFAHGLLRQGKFDLAAEEYERFLAVRPSGADRLDALFGLANARLDQGRYADSLRAFGDFLESAAGDPRLAHGPISRR